MTSIVLASSNKKKLYELQALLASKEVTLLTQGDFKIPDAVEDGHSFVENAIIKARHASYFTQLPAIADDSGLEVDALGGAPGIFSARFAQHYFKVGFPQLSKPSTPIALQSHEADAANNELLLELLSTTPPARRTARFHCVVAMFRFPNDPMPLICQGSWEGRIVQSPEGTHGFGYDPLFFVPSHNCTSASLSSETKNRLSHRGQALQQLMLRWPL